jgi:hypothetical protein
MIEVNEKNAATIVDQISRVSAAMNPPQGVKLSVALLNGRFKVHDLTIGARSEAIQRTLNNWIRL